MTICYQQYHICAVSLIGSRNIVKYYDMLDISRGFMTSNSLPPSWSVLYLQVFRVFYLTITTYGFPGPYEYFFRTTSPGGVCSLWPPLQVVEYFYNHLSRWVSIASPGQPLPLLPVLTRHYRELAGYAEFLIHYNGGAHPYAGRGAYREADPRNH